jgi:hypothetical protein
MRMSNAADESNPMKTEKWTTTSAVLIDWLGTTIFEQSQGGMEESGWSPT